MRVTRKGCAITQFRDAKERLGRGCYVDHHIWTAMLWVQISQGSLQHRQSQNTQGQST